ncbi:extracellular solute-binding protein [Ammoniphilus sp. YIM 78166]|uniref:extracellular solute-binding protein n=1 Tax=Ammoniphilus sp. YIM 78166 TaxID=1644106 RepID=UPI00106F39C3|nr:extracellular solute-binding protein [Ammoniphilus sp. YIM 78166]
MKKWFHGLLACSMAASLLVGCSSSSTSTSPQPTEKKKETEATKEEGPTKFSISLRTHKYKYVENHPNLNEDKWVKELENRTNSDLDIRLIPHQEYVEKMNLMMASGDIPDVVNAGGIHDIALAGALEAGIFRPLDDLLQTHGQNLLKVIPKKAWEEVTHEGKIYAIPEFLSVPARRGAYIRKDLLDKFNLPVPNTLDEFLHTMRVFKENGIKYPYSGREKFMYTELFFGPFDAVPTTYSEDEQGRVVPTFITPKMKDALAFYRNIYQEGLMDPEFLTNKYADWERKIVNGEVGMFDHNFNLLPSWQQKIKAVTPEAELAIIPSPLGLDGGRGVAHYSSILRTYMINAKYEHPEKVIAFFDWMVTQDATNFFNFGIEGENYTIKDGKIDYTYPTDQNQIDEEDYRDYWLWLVKDGAYNKQKLPYMPNGQEVVQAMEDIARNEGRAWINPKPLKAEDAHPELRTDENKQDLWQEYAAKIVLGELPLDAFDKFVQDYLKRGGDAVIKEATEKHKNGQTVVQ